MPVTSCRAVTAGTACAKNSQTCAPFPERDRSRANGSPYRRQLAAKIPMRVEAWDRDEKAMLAAGHVDSTDNSIEDVLSAKSSISFEVALMNAHFSRISGRRTTGDIQRDTHEHIRLVGGGHVYSSSAISGINRND